jgi:hypothetical protein
MVLLMATLLVALSFRCDFSQRMFTIAFKQTFVNCSREGWRKTGL